MKEVVLHIGFHKTGSTSIQSALAGYKNGRCRVASFDEQNHSVPIFTSFSERRYSYHIWKNRGCSDTEIEEHRARYIETFRRDLTDREFDRLVISGEDICALSPTEKQELIQFILGHVPIVKIVAYVRNPLSWVVSATQERIKNGNPVVKTGPNFQKVLAPLLELIPKENLSVFSFEDIIQKHKSITAHFGDLLNLDLKSAQNANASLTPIQLALTYSLNQVPLKITGKPERRQIRQQIKKDILNVKATRAGLEKLDTGYFHQFCEETIGEDCVWLEENFGISYDYQPGETKGSLPEYFQNILAGADPEVRELFETLGVEYDPAIGLEQNFLEAYIQLLTRPEENFDAARYLELNPDVKNAGVDPYEHYLMYGKYEGRRTR